MKDLFISAVVPVPASFSTAVRVRFPLFLAASAAALLICEGSCARAETWALPAGGSWINAGNWTPASIPNSIGGAAIFNASTANRTITNDAGISGITLGSLAYNNSATFTTSLTTGTAGSRLILDNGGAGVSISTAGTGTGNLTISVPVVFNDLVTAQVDQLTTSSVAGSLNLTAAISGTGGFVKQGDGLATFGTGAKTYTGPTTLSGGRMRSSLLASPSATSRFTVNAGAQLSLISAAIYTLGTGPLVLNGVGPLSGPFSQFGGAIRNDTNLAVTITNQVVLQSDTLLHVQGSASGSLAFPSPIGGPGSLTLTAPNSDANLGQLVLNGSNTYSGGTWINGGTIVINGPSATVGTGDVTVDALLFLGGPVLAKLSIFSGVLDAIADTATLTLALDGDLELQSGVNEIVSELVLDGVPQMAGTYGSTLSGATFQNDEYFSGTGIVTVVPEPATMALFLGGFGLLLSQRRSRRR